MSEYPALGQPATEQMKERLEDGSLFDEAILESRNIRSLLDGPPPAPPASQPRLFIHRPEDDDVEDACETLQCDDETSGIDLECPPVCEPAVNPEAQEQDDGWPWNQGSTATAKTNVVEDDNLNAEVSESVDAETMPCLVTESTHDESATEDVVLCQAPQNLEEPLAAFAAELEQPTCTNEVDADAEAMVSDEEGMDIPPFADDEDVEALEPALESNDAVSASEDESMATTAYSGEQRHAAPSRIGTGQRVSTRLNWRPGDPFGDSSGSYGARFRWDVMLTSAGVTAACGLGCIWLLRTIFI